ncbi:MAG TPA: LLM class flavin-dependent oxidoreductase [Anaerolineaceae bacterium]|nr:LLM class flavin-dependent oxidoreductase [Anaerolineaceae bacterium]
MRFGFVLPFGDARTAAELAREAELAGWDGFFVWEPVWGVDPWVSLTAAAMRTERIRLGTLLTPLPIRKPWKLAAETATLDNLSGGRVILSVGLGAVDTGFDRFGEPTDRKLRAELLDEGLEILTGLWAGQPFNYTGMHYRLRETNFYPPPPPVQQPRIPIWVVGAWPREKSMRRVLRFDGLLPNKMSPTGEAGGVTPQDLSEMKAYIDANRTLKTPFDIVMDGKTPGDDPHKAADIVRDWAEAGATWWIESMWGEEQPEKLITRLRQGPPRF